MDPILRTTGRTHESPLPSKPAPDQGEKLRALALTSPRSNPRGFVGH